MKKTAKSFKTSTFNILYLNWWYLTTYAKPTKTLNELIDTISLFECPNSISYMSYQWWVALEKYATRNSWMLEDIQQLLFLYKLENDNIYLINPRSNNTIRLWRPCS